MVTRSVSEVYSDPSLTLRVTMNRFKIALMGGTTVEVGLPSSTVDGLGCPSYWQVRTARTCYGEGLQRVGSGLE
jgi:hypothetical protein